MNNVDKQYLALMRDILENGTLKDTRAGQTLSIFGRSMTFDLQEGFPLLTTKKVFYKGIIHELIWFLKGDTNIKYLVDNNVHIWDDDAYRWFKTINFKEVHVNNWHIIKFAEYGSEPVHLNEVTAEYQIVIHGEIKGHYNCSTLKEISKEDFIEFVKVGAKVLRKFYHFGEHVGVDELVYTFGDLGPVYGAQWRGHGDQIKKIIETLKTNPDDRRMLCVAWNPDVLDKVALPPCHVMFQFYTRELNLSERVNWAKENIGYDSMIHSHEALDELSVPKRELSISFSMRSNDYACGWNFNVVSYSLLCHIIANICNMTVGKVIYFGGDIHLYCNHIEEAQEQLKRSGCDELPKLNIKRKLETIDDIEYDDFEIIGYNPDPPIKYKLNVG